MDIGRVIFRNMKVIVFYSLYMVSFATSIAIDNGVVGTSVKCTSESIAVNFATKNPFSGRIFVKGMSDKPECVRNYADGNPSPATPLITFTFGACNMFRSRTLSPQAGLLQMIIVVISFHKTFITKVDRAYKVQCFYTEAERIVTAHLEVSMLSTESLRDTQSMPTCVYEVRRGSRNGDVVRYANIGEAVFHEWECKSDQIKMLVKNCYVDDGQGNKHLIIDEKGCALDPIILSDLIYEVDSGNPKAWVESHVFKYADRGNLFFQCTIQICAKGDLQCDTITPPNCPHRRTASTSTQIPRQKERAEILIDRTQKVKRRSPDPEVDILTDPISVLDFDDNAYRDMQIRGTGVLPIHSFQVDTRTPLAQRISSMNSFCMPTIYFAFLLCLSVCLFLSTAILGVYIRMRRHLHMCCVLTTKA